MTLLAGSHHSTTVRWRSLEWWGAGTALFLQTGALFQLMLVDSSGGLDDGARSALQLVHPPVYFIALVLLARHPTSLLIAVRHNIPLLLLLLMPFLSVLWSIYPSVTLKRAVALFFSVALSFLLASRFTPRELLALSGAVLGTCIGLSLFLAIAAPGLAWDDDAMRGAFLNKNVLGWYAAFSTLVFCALAAKEGLWPRRPALLLLAASILCLVGSQSATALLAVISSILFAGFFIAFRRLGPLARIALVLIFLELSAVVLIGLAEYIVPLLEALGKDFDPYGTCPALENGR